MSITVIPCSPIQRSWLVGLLVTALLTLCDSVIAQQAPVVAVAADLQFTLAEIAQSFRRETGQDLRFSFGSSSKKAFYAYLQTPMAQAVFSRYGFISPDER